MALVRTDYGLIYNTDGSLCATLLPEGGVAVTEGTTNLCNPSFIYKNTWTTIDYAWGRRTIIDCSAGDVFTISADIRNLSQGTSWRWGQVSFRDSGGAELKIHNAMGSGMSEQRLSFTTPPAPVGTVEARVYWVSDRDEVTYQGKNFQIEKKPYATPFVEGTRPAGALSYNLPISINGDWTIAKWLELEPYFMDKSRVGDKPIGKYRLPLLELGKMYYTEGHGTLGIYGAWSDSQPGKTIRIMANKDTDRVYSSMPYTITLTEAEYNNKILAVLTKSGSMLTAYIYTVQNKYVLTCDITSLGDISQIAPRLNYHTVTASSRMYSKRHLNTLVCPYAVSPETIATWHSLDAPFFDPREITTAELAAKQYADQKAAEDIDASKRTIYAPGVQIDSTGLKIISPNGDYSLMGANQLRFFKAGYDVPFKYLARTCQGISPSGTYVNLKTGKAHYPDGTVVDMTTDPNYVGVVAVPWERKPVILPAISALKSYDPAFKGYEQYYECYVEQDQNGFYVYGRTIVPGSNYNTSSVNFTPSAYGSVLATQLLTPEADITKILIKFKLAIAYTRTSGGIKYGNKSWIKIEYRLDGTSNWTNYGTFYSPGESSIPVDLTQDVLISGLSPGKYWVKCTLYKDSAPNVTGEQHNGIATWVSWDRVNDTVVSNGDVLWLAVENSID